MMTKDAKAKFFAGLELVRQNRAEPRRRGRKALAPAPHPMAIEPRAITGPDLPEGPHVRLPSGRIGVVTVEDAMNETVTIIYADSPRDSVTLSRKHVQFL